MIRIDDNECGSNIGEYLMLKISVLEILYNEFLVKIIDVAHILIIYLFIHFGYLIIITRGKNNLPYSDLFNKAF